MLCLNAIEKEQERRSLMPKLTNGSRVVRHRDINGWTRRHMNALCVISPVGIDISLEQFETLNNACCQSPL